MKESAPPTASPAPERRWEPPLLELTGRADGPAPWGEFAALCVLTVAAMWGSAEFAVPGVTAAIAVAGLACFWLLLPKAEVAMKLPGWALAALVAAFVVGLLLAGALASIDAGLTAAGYWIWFVLWLQLGLWLTGRFGHPG